jgi:hypothetical protein
VKTRKNEDQTWTAHQLRNATPLGQGPQFIIRDRDDKFGEVLEGRCDRTRRSSSARARRRSDVDRCGRRRRVKSDTSHSLEG